MEARHRDLQLGPDLLGRGDHRAGGDPHDLLVAQEEAGQSTAAAGDVDEAEDENDDRAARAKIIAFYREHNPSKVQDVDALIAKYRDVGVGASELLIAVQKKYARDQPQRRANQFSV